MHAFFYITSVVVGVFLLLQLYVRFLGVLKKGKELHDLPPEFAKRLEKYPESLIYFYTPTCSACRVMTPTIDRLKQENENIIKVDLTKDFEVGRIFGVMGTPTIVKVKNKKIEYFAVGAKREPFLRKLLAQQ